MKNGRFWIACPKAPTTRTGLNIVVYRWNPTSPTATSADVTDEPVILHAARDISSYDGNSLDPGRRGRKYKVDDFTDKGCKRGQNWMMIHQWWIGSNFNRHLCLWRCGCRHSWEQELEQMRHMFNTEASQNRPTGNSADQFMLLLELPDDFLTMFKSYQHRILFRL